MLCPTTSLVGRRCAAQTSFPRPTHLMHTTEVWPIFGTRHQPSPHWVFANVLPLLRITFTIAQSMMKSTRLKSSCLWMHFGKAVFPKSNPTLDGKFQIFRRAKKMQVVGHEKVIADQPCGCRVLPDVMQRALNRSPGQPFFALLGADGEQNPVCSIERNVNTLGWCTAPGFAEGAFAHDGFSNGGTADGKDLLFRAERQLCPTNNGVGSALLRRPSFRFWPILCFTL